MAIFSILQDVGREFYHFDISEGIRGLSTAEVVKRALAVTVDVLHLYLTTVFVFLWLVYVAWRLYYNRDYHFHTAASAL